MTLARLAAGLAAVTLLGAGPAVAEPVWSDLRPMIFGEREIAAAPAGTVDLVAPYRASDDRTVPIGAEIRLPEGVQATRLTLVIDENPVPVSAVVDLESPRRSFEIALTMRLNGPSPVRAIVETTDGRLLMTERMVKTSGLGACAAPPGTDPEKALATLGEMRLVPEDAAGRLAALGAGAQGVEARGRLAIRHPSHSGLQMDQVSLLYIPARYVETVEIREDGAPSLRITGSISLSENPEIVFPYRTGATLGVRLVDSEGAVFETRFGPEGS